MSYFVKAKFPKQNVNDVIVEPVEKRRVPDRDNAYAFASQMMDRGALSITIRPEQSDAAN